MIFQQIKDWLLKEKTYIDHWFEIDERWRYLTVAISNVLIKYLIFFILMLNYSEHYQFNLFLSWFFSSFTAFIGYKFLVFATEGNHIKEYLKSTGILSFSYIINSVFLWLFVQKMGSNPYIAQAIILSILTLFNFLLFKHFAFKQQKEHFWEKIYAVFD